jgi:uncharacterized protein
MLIDLRELLSGARDEMIVSADIDMEVFKTSVGAYDIVGKEPVNLTISKVGKNKLLISGNGHIAIEIPCDRCLEPVSTDIDFSIEKEASISNTDFNGVEEQEEQDYIDGYNLDVDKLVFGEVLLSFPAKTLCKEDCKGLCLKCGANLNVTECGCDRESLDPRMSVFKDILNNFKEV